MDNAITETQSTLEGTNSRTTEAEQKISEVEDRRVEIKEAERKKEKKIIKEMRTTSETSGIMLNAQTFASYKFQKKNTKRKAMRRYLRR